MFYGIQKIIVFRLAIRIIVIYVHTKLSFFLFFQYYSSGMISNKSTNYFQVFLLFTFFA